MGKRKHALLIATYLLIVCLAVYCADRLLVSTARWDNVLLGFVTWVVGFVSIGFALIAVWWRLENYIDSK